MWQATIITYTRRPFAHVPRRQSEWEEIREGAGNSVFDGPPSPFDVWGHGDMMSALRGGALESIWRRLENYGLGKLLNADMERGDKNPNYCRHHMCMPFMAVWDTTNSFQTEPRQSKHNFDYVSILFISIFMKVCFNMSVLNIFDGLYCTMNSKWWLNL